MAIYILNCSVIYLESG